MKEKQTNEYQDLAMRICNILDDNKATDINLIDISKTSNVADYFVIATGTSRVQVRALMEELEHELEKDGIFVLRRDGVGDGRWVVLDYGVIVVHIFTADLREYYHVEKLWIDGKNAMNIAAIMKLQEKLQKEKEQAQKEEADKKSVKASKTDKKPDEAKAKPAKKAAKTKSE